MLLLHLILDLYVLAILHQQGGMLVREVADDRLVVQRAIRIQDMHAAF